MASLTVDPGQKSVMVGQAVVPVALGGFGPAAAGVLEFAEPPVVESGFGWEPVVTVCSSLATEEVVVCARG